MVVYNFTGRIQISFQGVYNSIGGIQISIQEFKILIIMARDSDIFQGGLLILRRDSDDLPFLGVYNFT